MILQAIRAGTTYDLNDPTYGIICLGDDGFGAPGVSRLSQRSPMQHGTTDVGFFLTDRRLNLAFVIDAASQAALFAGRARLLKIFTPDDEPFTIKLTQDGGAVRCIDCHLIDELLFGITDRAYLTQRAVAALYAPDPVWYDPAQASQVFALGGGGGVFAVPLAVPVAVGASTIDQTTIVPYAGSWRSEPIIRIVGPITGAVITNLATDEKLDFTGTTIAAGDYYEIDTRFGYKTVKDAAGANKISKLTSDSNLATFHLEPDPKAADGENGIRVAGTSANAATSVTLYWFSRYMGI